MTCSTPARLYQLRSKMTISPAAGKCCMYRCMYIWLFSRSEGAGSATRRKTRGLTRSVIALIVPPFPAASRPSKMTMTRRPLALTHSCRTQSLPCSLISSFSYSLRFQLRHRSRPRGLRLWLPSAAERPIELRARPQLGAPRLRQQQLLLEQVLVGGQDLDVAGEPGVVAGARRVGGVHQRRSTPVSRCTRTSASFWIVTSALATSR